MSATRFHTHTKQQAKLLNVAAVGFKCPYDVISERSHEKNVIALPDWLQLATALNLCKTYGILIYLKSMVKNRKFLGPSDSCFLSARCNIHNTENRIWRPAYLRVSCRMVLYQLDTQTLLVPEMCTVFFVVEIRIRYI